MKISKLKRIILIAIPSVLFGIGIITLSIFIVTSNGNNLYHDINNATHFYFVNNDVTIFNNSLQSTNNYLEWQ